jgi:hypothetical protein
VKKKMLEEEEAEKKKREMQQRRVTERYACSSLLARSCAVECVGVWMSHTVG